MPITTAARILAADEAANPPEQVLISMADLLTDASYDVIVGPGFLAITNALGALCSVGITDHGSVTWEYRSVDGKHVDPGQLVTMTLELLDPAEHRSPRATAAHRPSPAIYAAVAEMLTDQGMAATPMVIGEVPDGGCYAFAQTTVTNPAEPGRGIIEATDDGDLLWHATTSSHPDDGLRLTDIVAGIVRALSGAGHHPSNA